ncbi:hypothetical protein BX666DRAFT_1931109 [Dichotomocladium elegans]|nr:hypothetical protein BX666DRAFT_1931109 [Dichotomocladium elegans]
MYRERMAELNQEALMIAQGTHPDLVAMMERIEMKKNERIRTAETWRRYKRINYQRQLDGLEYQANIDFISGKNALRRTILESLNRKRWNMESERDKLMDTLTDSDRIPDPEVLLLRKRRRTADTRDLQKIAHFVGFPLAPRPEGIPPSSIDEDMVALGLLHAPRSPNQEDDCDVDENKLNRETPSSCESSSALDTYERSIRPCQGHLYYYGRLFKKGEHFTVVDGNGGRYNAKLLTSTDTEAVIQRTDGSKTKLPFIQLSRGIHQLFPKRS